MKQIDYCLTDDSTYVDRCKFEARFCRKREIGLFEKYAWCELPSIESRDN